MDSGVSPSSALDLYTGTRYVSHLDAYEAWCRITRPVATLGALKEGRDKHSPALGGWRLPMCGTLQGSRRTEESDAVVRELGSGTASPPAVPQSLVTTRRVPTAQH